MIRASAPLWTAEPSRVAGWSRSAGVAALFAVVGALTGLARAGAGEGAADRAILPDAVDAMRHGGEYYPVVAGALRGDGGVAGPLAFPLPTLATLAAPLPDRAASALLFALAAGVLMAWRPVFTQALAAPAARWGASLLLVAGLVPYLMPDALYAPEAWAGLFVALSLARWAAGARVEAAAWGACAATLAAAAGVFLLVMLLFAAAARAWREAAAWGAALGVLAVVAGAHGRAVGRVLGPIAGADAAPTDFGPLAAASAVAARPVALPLLGLATFGWLAWRRPAGLRVAGALWATAAFAALRPDGGDDWGLLVAAPALAGLAFAPDGLRDLGVAAFPGRRRRITVKRVVR